MQLVVLMGGLGTRLGELTKTHPKSMMEVEGLPFFDYELFLLKRAGFKDFLFLTGYESDEIEDYYGDGSKAGVSIKYCRDGEKLLGTGGAVRRAYQYLEDEFMLIYGDSFMDIDYGETLYRYEQAKKRGATCLMTVMKNAGRFDKSNCIVRNGKLVLYDKKSNSPDMDHIDYGISIYQKALFSDVPEGRAFDIADIQLEESVKGTCAVHIVNNRFYEIGRPESLEEFRKYIKRRFYEAHPAVFLDRDGVINEIVYNEDTEQLDSPMRYEEFKYLPFAEEALDLISRKGYYIFVVTNQPAAAKGKTSLEALYDINTSFVSDLAGSGIIINDVFMCPHHPEGSPGGDRTLIRKCDCRKPGTGLIEKGREAYNIDWDKSYMTGDSYTDILAGQKAGLKTAFIGDLKCDVCARLKYNKPDGIYKSLMAFARELPDIDGDVYEDF
ncbi:MAG: HAD-IIIA family hydrolase [Lachnospiraceae bacterium]|nr:HAD-IIIA family hydrolase [Lachnospiraceae bacterium]